MNTTGGELNDAKISDNGKPDPDSSKDCGTNEKPLEEERLEVERLLKLMLAGHKPV